MSNSASISNTDNADQQPQALRTVDSINELIDVLNNLATKIEITDDAPVSYGSAHVKAGFSINEADPTYTSNILHSYSNSKETTYNKTSIEVENGQTNIKFIDSSLSGYSLREVLGSLKSQHQNSPLTSSDVRLLLKSHAALDGPIGKSGNALQINTGDLTASDYEFIINVSDNFIDEISEFEYTGSQNGLIEKFVGITSEIPTASTINLQDYYNAEKKFFDYNKLNRDINLKAVYSGNILESEYGDALDINASLSLQASDSSGNTTSYISFKSRDNDRNLNGIYNINDIKEDSAEYDPETDTTSFELGLDWFDALNITNNASLSSDSKVEYIGGSTSASVSYLDSYSYGSSSGDFSLSFTGHEHIPAIEELTGDISFEANSLGTIDFSDSNNHGNLGLLNTNFETGNNLNYSASLRYDLFGTDTSGSVGYFRYNIGKGAYVDEMYNEGGTEEEYEYFSGYLSDSSLDLNSDYFAQLDTVWINTGGGSLYFNIDGADSNLNSSYGSYSGTTDNLEKFIPNWKDISGLHLLELGGLDSAAYSNSLYLKNQYQGESVLGLDYKLSAIDALNLSQGFPYRSDSLDQIAVLGDSVDFNRKYILDITAESLADTYTIESTDITINFDTNLFGDIDQEQVMIGRALPIANAVNIDNVNGTIRIAASSLSELSEGDKQTGSGITSVEPLVSIALDFDENQIQNIGTNSDGSLKISPLAFNISANQQETVFSRSFIESDTGLSNREIVTLGDLGGGVDVSGQDVTLYAAKINLQEQGDGLVLGTQRTIGTDKSFTNLVRSQDILSTSVDWLNTGNTEAWNLTFNKVENDNAELVNASFSTHYVGSGSFEEGNFVEDARESTTLTADIKITGEAGKVVDLADGIVSIQADGSSETFTNGKEGRGSSNLITYQGDLNYDGRVSMKDLAYLNAGAARQELMTTTDETGKEIEIATQASYSRDVDANFSGKIDLDDLAILDKDWGKTLHTSDQVFTGSDKISWNELDKQDDTSWVNDSFKKQNSIEADSNYQGSLESPTASGVIGADGNGTSDDGDLGGTSVFQDQIAL